MPILLTDSRVSRWLIKWAKKKPTLDFPAKCSGGTYILHWKSQYYLPDTSFLIWVIRIPFIINAFVAGRIISYKLHIRQKGIECEASLTQTMILFQRSRAWEENAAFLVTVKPTTAGYIFYVFWRELLCFQVSSAASVCRDMSCTSTLSRLVIAVTCPSISSVTSYDSVCFNSQLNTVLKERTQKNHWSWSVVGALMSRLRCYIANWWLILRSGWELLDSVLSV